LETQYPQAKFVERDLARDPLPHLDYRTVKAIFTRDQAEAESLKGALHLSNQVTEEVLIVGPSGNRYSVMEFRTAIVTEGMGRLHYSAGTNLPLHRKRRRRACAWEKSNSGACIRWSFH
jgi:hypothetical protein